jgi:hypothetical protein
LGDPFVDRTVVGGRRRAAFLFRLNRQNYRSGDGILNPHSVRAELVEALAASKERTALRQAQGEREVSVAVVDVSAAPLDCVIHTFRLHFDDV